MNGLDNLRVMAQAMIARDDHPRRPTWAPNLHDAVLIDLLRRLGLEVDTMRLWATFTDPRRGEVKCVGFELRPGQERGSNQDVVFRAQFAERAVVIARLKRWLADPRLENPKAIENSLRRWEARESDWTLGPIWIEPRSPWNKPEQIARFKLRVEATELGKALVLQFAGGTEGEIFGRMQAGARLTSRCCMCGKKMWDAKSLEYGIGPECRHGRALQYAPGALWAKAGATT